MDIEEDIKRCEQLIKPENANWIGISNQLAVAHIVDRIKELEEENEKLKAKIDVKNWQEKTVYECLKEKYIPKQKIENKIEEAKYNKKVGNTAYEYTEEDVWDIVKDVLEDLLEDK